MAAGSSCRSTSARIPSGGENFLYEIPYDADADWEADQYHAHLDTTDPTWSDPAVRHLVTIEIFDATGKRLRPNGTPATGQGGSEGTAPFTYRRKTAAMGPTTDVPFGALTHMFWWDNRPVHVEIVELVQDGVASTAECQFLVGTAGSQFSINYRAYHEQVLFNRNHQIWWKRGLAGATGDILNPGLGNVGFPGAPGASPSVSFGTMLGTHKRCAFTVFLGILGKMTDGDNSELPVRGGHGGVCTRNQLRGFQKGFRGVPTRFAATNLKEPQGTPRNLKPLRNPQEPRGTLRVLSNCVNAEQQRLEDARDKDVAWKRWGPYLSERAWGTVREDYSRDGTAWEYFPHDHARSRAYRWNEDGLAGICDHHQRICFALALWNGRDPILKERLFGLTGHEGNHGEDVKEYYFYLDSHADALVHALALQVPADGVSVRRARR